MRRREDSRQGHFELEEQDLKIAEKDILLDQIDEIHHKETGLGFKNVILGLAAMISIVAMVFPKIYIDTNIYRLSLEINTLYSNARSLKEEQRFLQQKLEAIKYQQDILNALR